MLYDSLSCQVLVSTPLQIADCRTRRLKDFDCNTLCGLERFWWVNSKDRYRLEDIGVHYKIILKW